MKTKVKKEIEKKQNRIQEVNKSLRHARALFERKTVRLEDERSRLLEEIRLLCYKNR